MPAIVGSADDNVEAVWVVNSAGSLRASVIGEVLSGELDKRRSHAAHDADHPNAGVTYQANDPTRTASVTV